MSNKTSLIEAFILAVGGGVVLIGGAILVSCVAAIPTFYLWNILMPEIFGLNQITFIQAIAINLLCECLFKSRSYGSSKNEKK
jgi:hypothetical protein